MNHQMINCFYFNENEFNKMVGHSDWGGNTFEVVQQGSKSWTGKVVVWNGVNNVHGRRNSNAGNGDWAQGDTIKLKTCAEKGTEEYKSDIVHSSTIVI